VICLDKNYNLFYPLSVNIHNTWLRRLDIRTSCPISCFNQFCWNFINSWWFLFFYLFKLYEPHYLKVFVRLFTWYYIITSHMSGVYGDKFVTHTQTHARSSTHTNTHRHTQAHTAIFLYRTPYSGQHVINSVPSLSTAITSYTFWSTFGKFVDCRIMEWQQKIGTPDTPFVRGSQLTCIITFLIDGRVVLGPTVGSFVLHKCKQSIANNSVYVFSNCYYRNKNSGSKRVRPYIRS
jgi:hypothetical protein